MVCTQAEQRYTTASLVAYVNDDEEVLTRTKAREDTAVATAKLLRLVVSAELEGRGRQHRPAVADHCPPPCWRYASLSCGYHARVRSDDGSAGVPLCARP